MFELLEQAPSFNSDAYFRHFAPYHFTLSRGFRELLDLLALDPSYTCAAHVYAHLYAERFAVQPFVPQEWKQMVGKEGDWGNCHIVQIERLVRGKPIRLDQYLQSTLALAGLFSKSALPELRDVNVFEFISAVPLMYALADRNTETVRFLRGDNTQRKDRWRAMIQKLLGVDSAPSRDQLDAARTFLTDASQGYPMSWPSVEVVTQHLHELSLPYSIDSLLKRRRVYNEKKKEAREPQFRSCFNEADFIRLDFGTVRRLENLKTTILQNQAGRASR